MEPANHPEDSNVEPTCESRADCDSQADYEHDAADENGPVKVWDSAGILGGRREAIILHGDQVYRLLCTRNGKLILQK